MEHWETLCRGGYCFVYDDTLFRPGTDSFVLASLPRLKPGLRVADLGCGTGLLGFLLFQRQSTLTLTGIDIQGAAVALAQKAAAVNRLDDRMRFLTADLREIRSLLPTGSFDLAVCNPPYYPAASGAFSPITSRSTARSETCCTLDEICHAAAYLLRWGGRFCIVHKPERLTDLICTLRNTGIEPKRLRAVSKTAIHAPSLFLVEAVRGGRPGLTVEPPLALQTPDGMPTNEANAIYFRTQEETL